MLKFLTFFCLTLPAWAQQAGAPAGSQSPLAPILVNLPMIAALVGLFYFGMIRPQRQQQKQQQSFWESLKTGDEVTTNSGIIGTVRGLTDRVVTLEIARDTEIKVLRTHVQNNFKDAMATANAPSKKN